jgi:superfamily II DNA or RNA helicase
MNRHQLLELFRGRGLKAWQAAFAASVLEIDPPAYYLLEGMPGTGKKHVGVVITTELVARGARRVLVLPPASLCEGWKGSLEIAHIGLPVTFVTRRVFRELEDGLKASESPWNSDGIYVVGQDLAKGADFAGGLAAIQWDLVVVDEAHRFVAPLRAALLDRMITAGVVGRLLLLSPTPISISDQTVRLPSPLTVTSWFGVLNDWDGVDVNRLKLQIQAIPYSRCAEEVKCWSQVLSSMSELEAASGGNKLLSKLLTLRASSSLFAFEQSLRRLGNTLGTTNDSAGLDLGKSPAIQSETDSAPDESGLADADSRFKWADMPAGLAIIDRWLEALESIGTDEKLNALRSLIRTVADTEVDGVPRICVLSKYSDTVSYLHTALEDVGVTTYKVSGTSSFTERQATIERFLHEGGLILGTDASFRGVAIPQVTHVVHYDVPTNPLVLAYRHGRFDRFGRMRPLEVRVFRDESGAIPFESRVLESVLTGLAADSDGVTDEKNLVT